MDQVYHTWFRIEHMQCFLFSSKHGKGSSLLHSDSTNLTDYD